MTVLLAAVPASAAIIRPYEGAHSLTGLANPESLAVDQASGDLYVLVQGEGKVLRYDDEGNAAPFSASASYISGNELTGTTEGAFSFAGASENQIAVAPAGAPGGTAGDLYVAEPNVGAIDVFASSGEYLGRITEAGGAGIAEACGVATDPAGNVYVGTFPATVEKFIPTANSPYAATFDSRLTGLQGICNIAASSSKLYASTWAIGPLNSYPLTLFPGGGGEADASSSGTTVEVGGSAVTSNTVAVDPADDFLFVDEGNQIAEFDAAGTLRTHFGSSQLANSHGIAADDLSGGAFAAESSSGEVAAFAAAALVEAPTVTIDPVTTVTATTAHLSGRIDPNGTDPGQEVSWHFECTPGCHGTTSGTLAPGTAAEPVEAEATGLEPNMTYTVTLVAENAGGATEAPAAGDPPVNFTTAAVAPTVAIGEGSSDGEGGAVFTGEVNPHNSQVTSCVFQFGPTEAYGQSLPCQPSPGSGSGSVLIKAHPSGLAAGTTYHFRIVATNGGGTETSADETVVALAVPAATQCPNEGLRVLQGSTYLPDCRAYELVSPADKDGYKVGGNATEEMQLSVSPDGARVSYVGLFPLPGSNVGSNAGLLGSRDSSGWQTSGILAAPGPNQYGNGLPGGDATLDGTTPDQRTSVYFNATHAPFGTLEIVRADGSRAIIAEASVAPFASNTAAAGALPGEPWFEGISDDGKHVVFADTDALLPGITSSGSEILYEWSDDGSHGGEGSVRVVNRTNDRAEMNLIDPSADAELGGSMRHRLTGINACVGGGLRDAISADGSRIFFQTPASEETPLPNCRPLGGGPLYLREDGVRTVEVSAAASGYTPIHPPTLVQFLDASHSATNRALDGSYAFFWANGDLAPGAPAAGGIYRYDVDTEELSFIAGAAPATGEHAPTAIASDDGSHLYYEDGADLKLYVDGESTVVRRGTSVDGALAQPDRGTFFTSGENVGLSGDLCQTADISSDGRFLAFTAGNGVGGSPLRVFRYDAGTGTLTNITGPLTPVVGPDEAGFGSSGSCGTSLTSRNFEGRVMSRDGSSIFFETAAALVPQDNNSTWDVYEWHEGKVSLLSSGRSSGPSLLDGTDTNGGDVFFTTADSLVRADPDTVADVYDVRIGGGFASQTESPAPGCSAEACQGPGSVAPSSPGVASAQLSGPADAGPREAKKHHHKRHRRHHHKRHRRHRQNRRHRQRGHRKHRREHGRQIRHRTHHGGKGGGGFKPKHNRGGHR